MKKLPADSAFGNIASPSVDHARIPSQERHVIGGNDGEVNVRNRQVGFDERSRPLLDSHSHAPLFPYFGDLVEKISPSLEGGVASDEDDNVRHRGYRKVS